MNVYKLRLILGKVTNYDQSGKLKNPTIIAKYVGEGELEIILADQNWKKLGACEISCVDVYDSTAPTVSLEADVKRINDRIKSDIQSTTKPKTEIELLKEQIASLTEKVNAPAMKSEISGFETVDGKSYSFSAKEIRESLFTEAAELGLKPAKNIKTDILKDLIANAKKEKA